MKQKRSENTNYYDIWSIPDIMLIPEGVSLQSFVKGIQEFLRMGEYEKVLNTLNEKRQRCLKSNHENYACAYFSLLLGIALRKSGQPELARENISQALEHFQAFNDIENSTRCLIALGDTWRAEAMMFRDSLSAKPALNTALKYYKKAQVNLGSLKEEQINLNISLNLLKAQSLWAEARVLLATNGSPDVILNYLLSAWQISLSTNSIWAQEEVAQLLGRFYESEEHLEKAHEWYLISLSRSRISHNVDRLIENCLYLAKMSLVKKEFQMTEKYLKEGEEILLPLLKQSLHPHHQFFDFFNNISELKKALVSVCGN